MASRGAPIPVRHAWLYNETLCCNSEHVALVGGEKGYLSPVTAPGWATVPQHGGCGTTPRWGSGGEDGSASMKGEAAQRGTTTTLRVEDPRLTAKERHCSGVSNSTIGATTNHQSLLFAHHSHQSIKLCSMKCSVHAAVRLIDGSHDHLATDRFGSDLHRLVVPRHVAMSGQQLMQGDRICKRTTRHSGNL